MNLIFIGQAVLISQCVSESPFAFIIILADPANVVLVADIDNNAVLIMRIQNVQT